MCIRDRTKSEPLTDNEIHARQTDLLLHKRFREVINSISLFDYLLARRNFNNGDKPIQLLDDIVEAVGGAINGHSMALDERNLFDNIKTAVPDDTFRELIGLAHGLEAIGNEQERAFGKSVAQLGKFILSGKRE